jgi:NADPH:quinone reductase-like Zn-dependent oxidoreductase
VKIPGTLDWDSAAGLPGAPFSAWYCLQRLARFRSGENVLIWAATSGVGDAAVQIAKHLGATVIATAGTDEKVA